MVYKLNVSPLNIFYFDNIDKTGAGMNSYNVKVEYFSLVCMYMYHFSTVKINLSFNNLFQSCIPS